MGWRLGCRALFRTLGMGVYDPCLSVAWAQGSCGRGELVSRSRSILFRIVRCRRSEGCWNWRRRSGGNSSKRFINSFTRRFPLIRDVGNLAILRWPHNYRREHPPPGHEEILCLAHAKDKIWAGTSTPRPWRNLCLEIIGGNVYPNPWRNYIPGRHWLRPKE